MPLVAGWVATAVARGVLAQRFTPAEGVVVHFWARTPLLTLVVATALGALPLLIVNLLASSLGWSPTSTQVAVRAVILLVAVFAVLTMWWFWVQVRDSLPDSGNGAGAA
jgi:Tfp pilus assembly protein PilO